MDQIIIVQNYKSAISIYQTGEEIILGLNKIHRIKNFFKIQLG